MKKRSVLITTLSIVFIICLSAFTALGGFFNNAKKVNAKDNNEYWSNYFTVANHAPVTFTSNASLPSWANNVTSSTVTGSNSTVYNGLGVTFSENDTIITYNTPILVESLTKDRALIEYFVAPTNKTTKTSGVSSESDAEFSRVTVRLQGVENPNEYVEISNVRAETDVTLSWVNARTNTANTFAGIKKGETVVSDNNGTPITTAFTGTRTNATGLFYDNASSSVYTSFAYYDESTFGYKKGLVRDFTSDGNLLDGDAEFSGFTGKYATLSITFNEVYHEGSESHVILTKILGQSLNGTTLNDKTAPFISMPTEYEKDIPVGEVNHVYPFWNVLGYDAIEGDISSKLTYSVRYVVSESKTELFADNDVYFTPTKAGTYRVTISLKDSSSNSAENKVVEFSVVEKVDDINLTFEDESALSERAFAGERIILPAYSVSGGSGNLNVSVVVKNGENTVDVKNNSFTVESAGNYIISYVVTDYIGKSVEKSFNIQTEISQKPVIRLNDIVVPTEYKNGAIILNVPKAYDYYTFLGYGEEVPVKVYAVSYTAGTQVSDANYVLVSANETGDYVYIPSTSADRMKIRYEATSLMGETEVVYSNEIVLYSVGSLVKYWGFDSNDVSLAVGALESGDIGYFFRPLKNGAKINYLIPLQASEFSLGLSFENGYANFNKVSVVLSDSTMANEVITLSLTTKNHDSVYVTTGNGNKSYTKGEICDVDYISTILFKLKSKTELVDANGNLILNLTNFDSGAEFNGFTSDKIYVSVIIDEIVSTSANNRFSIASFYNQGRYLFSTGNDVNGPKVVTNGSVDTVYDYLETIVLPTAKAYDMCSTNCTTNVTVVDPNGTTILSGVKANRTNSFVASVYDVYTITYTSRDEEGNVTNLKYLATVVDTENPVIEISGQVTTTARVNSYLTVRSFTATDNVSTNANILKYVFIETPNYGYKAVQVNGYSTATYKFEVAGEYKLVYVAMDKAGNIAYKTFTITVT